MKKQISFWTLTFLSMINYVVQGESMIVLGHRGACGYEPENTLLSFKKALEIGVDMIEFDVRKTVDDKLVIMHDAAVDRTTDGTGLLADMTFSQLRKLDAGKGQKIPTLQEVFDLVDRKVCVDIEIKEAESVSELVLIIDRYINEKGWSYDDFLVSSFDLSALQNFQKLAPAIQLMPIFSRLPVDWLGVTKNLPANIMAISYKSISKKIIVDAHQNDISVIVYTVNDPKKIFQMIKLGVDGICSDYPDRVKKVLF